MSQVTTRKAYQIPLKELFCNSQNKTKDFTSKMELIKKHLRKN